MTKKILLIDDDTIFAEVLEAGLTDAGFCVVSFSEVDDIFKTIEQQQPDLILMDYLLQGINGGDLCCQIKRNRETLHIPVILMSAYLRVLLSLGTYNCDEFIEKPLELSFLSERLKYHLKKVNTGTGMPHI